MQIIRISPRGFASNTYAVTADNKTAIVIDPSQPRVLTELERLGLLPVCVLLTHCHFDHVGGVPTLQAQGARVFCSETEKPLTCTAADMASAFGAPSAKYTVEETFSDGETKTLCGLAFKAVFTPGHTKGGVSYLVTDETGARSLFTGDVLFQGSIGRTDLATGDLSELRQSLRKLVALEGDMPVYAGHGEETTLETERRTNPFLRDL